MSDLPDEDCPRGGKHQPLAAGDANDGGPIHCYKCQTMLRGRHVDALPDERRGELVALLAEHADVTVAATRATDTIEATCACGAILGTEAGNATAWVSDAHRAHLADALEPMLAGWRHEDEAKALREAADRFESEMSIAWGGDDKWLTNGNHLAGLAACVLREWADDRQEKADG